MLFSEPKIPQSLDDWGADRAVARFSALQRAENSSILFGDVCIDQHLGFSALQRAENSSNFRNSDWARAARLNFSALQRAENSSNATQLTDKAIATHFSALQRAENSSKGVHRPDQRLCGAFQCSSASRKFLKTLQALLFGEMVNISVLFSEPKIPQTAFTKTYPSGATNFSALQRAENSSKSRRQRGSDGEGKFQCSSASRKFLKRIEDFPH